MSDSPNKEIVRQYFAFINDHNFDALGKVVASDLIDHKAYPGQPAGLAGLVSFFEAFRIAFPDFTVTLEDMVGEDNRIAARFYFQGTHTGDLFGVSGSGEQVKMEGFGIFRLQDGVIVELWGREDVYGLMQQIGALSSDE